MLLNGESLKEKLLAEETLSAIKVFSSLLGISLFLTFWVSDILIYPDHKWEFLAYRFLIVPFCVITHYFLNRVKTYSGAQKLATLYTIASASIINIIVFRTDDIATSYYAGLNLVAIAGIAFVPLTRNFAILSALGIYTPYVLNLIFYITRSTSKHELIIPNIFFIAGSITVCLWIRNITNKLRIRDLESQAALKDELNFRELIINKKTEEATRLHQLSSQFSPQVVKAIKEGQLQIEKGGEVSEICAIFIDIVRSTDKVTTLDHQDIQLSLERFLDSCLTTFLKYDLTIDKFHGDGILAFSNMPLRRQDFIERSCDAALEAIDIIKKDQNFYLEHWKDELKVRVGISVGKANVGFYGNKKYFKTFTAIGTPLPYASRLTSIAQPNQILIDDQIHTHLVNLGYVTRSCGLKTLKGFEDDSKTVYELISSPRKTFAGESIKTCPSHPDSVLYLNSNQHGLMALKCRECDYEEIQIST